MATGPRQVLSGSSNPGRQFLANIGMVGGILTGTTSGEFLSLPVAGGGGPIGADAVLTPAGSKVYLSSSFNEVSGSIIQALNFLKTQITDAGDITFLEVNQALQEATGSVRLGRVGGTDGVIGGNNFSIGTTDDTDLVNFDANILAVSGTLSASLGFSANLIQTAGTISANSTIAGGELQSMAGISAGTTITGSGLATVQGVIVDLNGIVAVAGDTDLMNLAVGAVTVSGNVNTTAKLKAGTGVEVNLDQAYGVIGDDDLISVAVGRATISGSLVAEAGIDSQTVVSGAGNFTGQNMIVDLNGKLGVAGDTDLINMAVAAATVSGSLNTTAKLKAGTGVEVNLDQAYGVIGDDDLISVAVGRATISGSMVVETGLDSQTTVSGAGNFTGQNMIVDLNGKVGVAGDTDLINMAVGRATISGSMVAKTGLVSETTVSGAGPITAQTFKFEGTTQDGIAALYQLQVAGGILQLTSGSL